MPAQAEETPIARVRLDENRASEIHYADDLHLVGRKYVTNDDGKFELSGDPEGDVYQRHMDLHFIGLPEGQETNPLRRSILAGKVFVIDGIIPASDGTPLISNVPLSQNAAEKSEERWTRKIEGQRNTSEPESVVKRRVANDAVKVEGRKILEGTIREITRNLNPRVANVRASGKDYLLVLISYIHYRELEAKSPRKMLIAQIKEYLKTLDPAQAFIFTVEDDDDIDG